MTGAPRTWPLVGRARELESVRELLDGEESSGVLIAGQAGVGKSRLAAECVSLGEERGVRCEQVRATRASAAIPLGALAALLPPALAGAAEVRGDLLRRAADALRSDDRLMLVIDDAHLLDDASAIVVQQVAGWPSTFLVLTTRSGEPLSDAVRALWKESLVARLDLGPLRRDDVDSLVREVLGGPVDGATRRDLWVASQGNALFVHELVLGALDADILRLDAGVWRLARPLETTPRLIELVEARVADLDDAERAALELLAVGEPLPTTALERMGLDPALLSRLEERGLVRFVVDTRGPVARMAHPLHAEVLRERMGAMTRLAASRRLAEAFSPDAPGDDIVRIAVWQLEGGGSLDADVMLAAARRAFFAHDPPLAERLARASMEAGAHLDGGLLLAQILGALNRNDDRLVLLDELLPAAPDDDHRALLAMERALTLFWGLRRGAEADDTLLAAEAALVAGAARDEVTALRAILRTLMGRPTEAIEMARPFLEAPADERAVVTASIAAAPALAICGRAAEAMAVADRGWEIRRALGDQEVMSGTSIHVASRVFALAETGRLEEATAVATVGYDIAVADYSDEDRAWFTLLLGRTALLEGALTSAEGWFSESAGLYDGLGQEGPRRWSLAGRALAAAQRSDVDDTAAAIADLDGVGDSPMLMMEPDVMRARGWAAWVFGQPRVAKERLLSAAATAEASGSYALAIGAWHDVARLGWVRDAAPRLAALADRVDGDLATARCLYATALEVQDAGAVGSAAEAFEEMGAHLFAAEAAAAAAAEHRRGGDRRAGERWSRRSTVFAARCQGARTPPLLLAGPAGTLTPRELEVARLAASGLTSKDIAGRLTLSVRTVDTHLRQAYVKLGVSGRADLEDALVEAGDRAT